MSIGAWVNVPINVVAGIYLQSMANKDTGNPTIRDVAKLARVGLMTVSRVINDVPSVRPQTRKKVEAAITQLGYKQNEAAQLMKGRRAKMIGLIVPDLSDAFFASCAHTVQQIARQHGFMTLVVSSERDAELELSEAELMDDRKVSGILIVTSARPDDERLKRLQSAGMAIVAFDRPLMGVSTDCVLVENRSGAEEATAHLIQHGHRQIACIGYDEETYTIGERILGYTYQMTSAGLKPLVAMGLKTLEAVSEWLAGIMKTKTPPTAIFSLNHRTSTFLLQALNEQKLRIPEDIAVIGFDDFDLAALLSPPLTTVAQSPVDLTRRSMSLLINRIQNVDPSEPFTPAKVLLPVKLILRGSCGTHKSVKS